MTTKSRFKFRHLFIVAAVIALVMPWAVLADNVNNNVEVGGNDTIAAGGSTTINYWIVATGGSCNPANGSSASVSIHAPDEVTATPSELVFSSCGSANAQSVQFTSNVPGAYPISVSVQDSNPGNGYHTNPASFTLNVNPASVTLTAPVLSLPADIHATATSSAGAEVNYLATASDEQGAVPIQCNPASGSTFALGPTTVNCSATNAAGTTNSSFNVTVTYAYSGVLQPINADGSSIFKQKSTVPVKFQLTGDSAGISDAVARISVAKISNNVVGADEEVVSTAAATSGNLFRYDANSDQYMFNLGTRTLSTGTYQVRIDLGDGTSNTVIISLR